MNQPDGGFRDLQPSEADGGVGAKMVSGFTIDM